MPTREQIIVQNVTPFLKPHSHVLEIGAGNGLVAQMLHHATGAQFTLLDKVDYNRSAFPMHVHDGGALPFADNTFDLAMLVFVLHHNPDPRPVLCEALRVSRQGVLIVENNVRGAVKRPFTRLVDSAEYIRRGVPRCYFTKSEDEWHSLFHQLPAKAQTLSSFKIGWFWDNLVLHIAR